MMRATIIHAPATALLRVSTDISIAYCSRDAHTVPKNTVTEHEFDDVRVPLRLPPTSPSLLSCLPTLTTRPCRSRQAPFNDLNHGDPADRGIVSARILPRSPSGVTSLS